MANALKKTTDVWAQVQRHRRQTGRPTPGIKEYFDGIF
jgi:hypothetical protein